jgi:hypothetical protein
MFEWIISYENAEALETIKKIGIIEFEPEFPELKFILMRTYLKKETIKKIPGVTECEESRTGTIDSQIG